MRKAVMPFVLSMGLIAVLAAPADAASTRAEYVAQVDPICVAGLGAETNALGAVSRNSKRWAHAAKARNVKAFIRTTRRLAGSVNAYARVHASVTDQIAAVAPPADDAATVGTWLNDRRQAEGSYRSAASALNLFKVRKFFSLLRRGDSAEVAGMGAISGLGFQTCGVSV